MIKVGLREANIHFTKYIKMVKEGKEIIAANGSLTAVSSRPFETIRAAISLNPYGIILGHNHPSGDPEPSPQDKVFTIKLKSLADAGGLVFHDHIII